MTIFAFQDEIALSNRFFLKGMGVNKKKKGSFLKEWESTLRENNLLLDRGANSFL